MKDLFDRVDSRFEMLTVIPISIEENRRRGLGTESLFGYLGFLKCLHDPFCRERERETKEEEGEKRQMIKFEFINAVVVSTKIVTRVANEACGLVDETAGLSFYLVRNCAFTSALRGVFIVITMLLPRRSECKIAHWARIIFFFFTQLL